MAESSLKSMVSEFLLLSDRYEKRARLLPGLFAVVPLAVFAYVSASTRMAWYQSVGLAAVTEALLAILAGHLSRALGRGVEERLFSTGLPTSLWLSSAGSRSAQQREQWRLAIVSLTGLDIYASKDPEEERKVIADAVVQVRARLRGTPEAVMVQTHNEEYGFARNLAGLVPVWLACSALGLVFTVVAAVRGRGDWLAVGIEAVFLVSAIAYSAIAKGYVRRSAERYTESLLSVLLMVAARLTSGG
jgi:hypothetical protein